MSVSSRTAQPTVIVVRERPKAAWVIGAAAIGAVFAVLASRVVMSSDASPTSAASPSVPTSVAPTAVVVAPVIAPAASPVAPIAPTASIAVMRFGDDQGVAFKAPPRPPLAIAPAASPGKLDHGSLSLGASSGTTTRTSSVAPPPPPSPPAAGPKRALTPEQQLAEAQLKASMR